ncbi:molybdopterin-guanine dinucleotide biosynthesis protein B [Cytobacillus eiseniae]|uniref:Molybdopterin-guanine dinucleotide biosynthesis protein B n=1 Tax=Cytobacillus eiseniae TaxID=762947 RepID=A0ABS4RE11_9BACI|nr:molybdopterin-guanine dinucleotide biosynthesis protein B [Cytobacillus eiseniae]MBP2241145.1 molybdopterin-guanine dinucleotide biosynthesis protein B [Cytobacillus eiseniae]
MAVVTEPVVFQVVGYQNSGKTTVVKQIIESLSAKRFKVATIKHHGHGGKPDIIESKDSHQHITSGAFASLVEGDGRILLQAEQNSWLLDKQIQLLSSLNPNFILVEGHKSAHYPKIVLVRNTEDHVLLTKLTNIKAVFYWGNEPFECEEQVPPYVSFHINDSSSYEWICNFLICQIKKS